MCHECNMGMGNDGIDASNSLDTCIIQLNNSGIHDMNDKGSTDDMQNGITMGNTSGVGEIESTAPGAPTECGGNVSNSGVIKNATSQAREDVNNQNLPQLDSETSTAVEVSQHLNEKVDEISNSLCTTEVASNDKGDENVNRDALPNASREGSDVISRVGGLEVEPRPDPSPVPVCRNESLLRVSHMKRDWGGKRVTDVRTVSELLEVFYSLEEPIITPLPRHHNYYDQWARNPRCDVIQRLYPRANSTGSPKCWTLFQIIQNDQQGKAIANPSSAPNPQRLAPPSATEVNCQSLDSIIDHYNQMLHRPPTEVIPTTPPLPHRSASSQNRTNSGSSRSSSCSSSRGNAGNHAAGGLRTPMSKAKSSPVPLRKLANISQSKEPSYTNGDSKQLADTPKSDKRCRKNSSQDYEAISTSPTDRNISISERSHHHHPHPKTPKQQTSPLPSNPLNLKVTEILVEDKETDSDTESELKGPARFGGTMSARETRKGLAAVTHRPEKNRLEDSAPDATGKTGERNAMGINPNTLSLLLPYETYERAHTVAEIHTQQTNSNSSGNKPKPCSHHQEDIVYDQGRRKAKAPDKHERFPLRSTAFVSRGRRANTTLEFVQNKTRLKNLTRSIPKSSHQNVQNLKDSLVIHEINCDLDASSEQRKWDYPFKSRRSGHGPKTQPSLFHKSRPVAQLPDRMHSMLEEHLAPQTPPVDSLSPEVPPSRGNSAVSLASVHFLDLADLRNLLKKSKTTLSYL